MYLRGILINPKKISHRTIKKNYPKEEFNSKIFFTKIFLRKFFSTNFFFGENISFHNIFAIFRKKYNKAK